MLQLFLYHNNLYIFNVLYIKFVIKIYRHVNWDLLLLKVKTNTYIKALQVQKPKVY